MTSPRTRRITGDKGDSSCPTTLPAGISQIECLLGGKINILQGATTSVAGTYAPEVKTLTTSGPITASAPNANGRVLLTVTSTGGTNYPAQSNTWVPTQRFNGDALTNPSFSLVYTGGQNAHSE